MKRKSQPRPINSTQPVQPQHHFDAERSIRSFQHRLLTLEKIVDGLTNRVLKLEGIANNSIYPGILESTDFTTPEQKKPGPKTIHDVALTSQRDRLIQMLESFWPELEPFCRPKPDNGALGHVFRQIIRYERQHPGSAGRHVQAAEHLLKHLLDLAEFLSSNRYRRDPRQIANAFAGRANIGFWRSLKRCQAFPSDEPIGQRAICAYLRRKHLRLFERLSEDYSLPNFVNALRAYRGKDRQVRALTAEYLYMCWKKCNPDPSIRC